MKIEVDTKHDSREELSALADMLQRLGRSSGSGAMRTVNETKPKNIFEDSSPSVGMFNMFSDEPSTPATSTMSAAEPVQNEPAGGLFSLFGDDPKPDMPSTTLEPTQSMITSTEPTVAELLSGNAETPNEDEPTTSAREVFDGDDIVPY